MAEYKKDFSKTWGVAIGDVPSGWVITEMSNVGIRFVPVPGFSPKLPKTSRYVGTNVVEVSVYFKSITGWQAEVFGSWPRGPREPGKLSNILLGAERSPHNYSRDQTRNQALNKAPAWMRRHNEKISRVKPWEAFR